MRVFLIIFSLLSIIGFAFTLQDVSAAEKSGRHGASQSVIDFDDETIEGLNKRPLDSLSQISEKDKRHRKPHLYRKRVSFRSETGETLRILKYTQ